MTDEVASRVLRDNYFQTQSLSVSGRIAPQMIETQTRLIRFLEKTGRLNRALEYLPSDEEIAERRAKGIGLASPERAVLLAYSKIWLYDELLASRLPDDPWVITALERYFPKALRERFAPYMPRHPLRREIIATHVTNSMLNRVGSTFVHRLKESTGAAPPEIVRAYLLQREVFGLVTLWQAIEALDNKVSDGVQADMLIDNGRLIARGTTWFLRSRRLAEDMAATIAHFAPAVEALNSNLDALLDAHARIQIEARAGKLEGADVPRELARRIAASDFLFAALDITEVATALARPVDAVARVYFELATQLEFQWLRDTIGRLPAEAHWQMLAKSALRDDLAELQRGLTTQVLADAGSSLPPLEAIAAWESRCAKPLERARQVLGEVKGVPAADLAMLSVAVRELRGLV